MSVASSLWREVSMIVSSPAAKGESIGSVLFTDSSLQKHRKTRPLFLVGLR